MAQEILCQLGEVERPHGGNLPGSQTKVINERPLRDPDFRLPVISTERLCGSRVHHRDSIRDVNSHSNCSCLGCVLGRSAKRLWHFRFLDRFHRRSTHAAQDQERRLPPYHELAERMARLGQASRNDRKRPPATVILTVSLVCLLSLIAYSSSALAVIMGSEQGVKQSSSTVVTNSGAIWPKDPRLVIVDGNVYPYTSAGLQAAINLASTNATGGNSADVYLAPHANFALGSTGITIPTNVCLIGLGDPNSESITYNGTGAAITLDATAGNISNSCIRNVGIFLGPSAGPVAVALLLKSTNGSGTMQLNEFDNINISASAVNSANQNQVGIFMNDSTGAPAGVAQNIFTNIRFNGVSVPIIDSAVNATCTASATPYWCCTGLTTGSCNLTGEANMFYGIRFQNKTWQSAMLMNDADSIFDIWQSAQPQNCSAGSPCYAITESGRMNQARVKCDNGSTTSFGSVDDTGSRNEWHISALCPIGVISATSNVFSYPSATIGTAGDLNQFGLLLNDLTGYNLNSNILFSATAPTISSGFGTTPSIVSQNGTAGFQINVGTGGTATSGVIGLPTAPHGWTCNCTDLTTNSTTVFVTKETANATTSCTVGNFSDVAAAAAWVASDKLWCSAIPN